MKTTLKSVIAATVLLTGMNALAQPHINGEKHPRRKEVVNRAEHEKNKNNEAAVDGKITDAQAKKLDKQDSRIEHQEQAEAAANGGKITKGEQRQLNREENRVNRERRNMEKKDAAATPAQPIPPVAAAPATAPTAGQ